MNLYFEAVVQCTLCAVCSLEKVCFKTYRDSLERGCKLGEIMTPSKVPQVDYSSKKTPGYMIVGFMILSTIFSGGFFAIDIEWPSLLLGPAVSLLLWWAWKKKAAKKWAKKEKKK